MSLFTPTYDGQAIFGYSISIAHEMNPPVEQVNAFFGITGTQSLYGGLRGRVFLITGVFYGTTMADLNTVEALYQSYCDGVARVLYDTRGRTWPYVKLKPIQPQSPVKIDQRGFYMPYRGSAMGLI